MFMENKELFSNERIKGIVDIAKRLEGKPLDDLVSRMCVNYVRVFAPNDLDFRDAQRKTFNSKNLENDPVYQKMKDLYYSNQNEMRQGESIEANKIANYALDVVEKLDNRAGLNETEYSDLLDISGSDLVERIKKDLKISDLCFFEKMELVGDNNYNSPIWNN